MPRTLALVVGAAWGGMLATLLAWLVLIPLGVRLGVGLDDV